MRIADCGPQMVGRVASEGVRRLSREWQRHLTLVRAKRFAPRPARSLLRFYEGDVYEEVCGDGFEFFFQGGDVAIVRQLETG